MIIHDENRLKAWISYIVQDISDAEPDALASYVIALVRKPLNDSELEKLCLDKLSVFLQSHTESFVSQLFSTLKSGKYLTQNFSLGEQKVKTVEDTKEKFEEAITAKSDELLESYCQTDKDESIKEQISEAEVQPLQPMKDEKVGKHVKENSREMASNGEQRGSISVPNNAPPSATKPLRKRISPPPRSPERQAKKRFLPIRRRIIVATGAGSRTQQFRRYHRSPDVRTKNNDEERSRSPHIRKGKDNKSEGRPRHRLCRDFHDKGYCMRGDTCHFDHGPDPMVVANSTLQKIVQSGDAAFEITSSYEPNPPPPGVECSTSESIGKLSNDSDALVEGYNPEAPALTAPAITGIDFSIPPPPIPHHYFQAPAFPSQSHLIYPPLATNPSANILPTYPNSAGLVRIRPAPPQPSLLPLRSTTNIYGPNAMRGRRFVPYGIMKSAMGVNRFSSRSLLVKNIPRELNKIAQLDQHFGKFGQITNIQVQHKGRPDSALVTFKTRREAIMAYNSTEPIFNNRLIKVMWQNDTPTQPTPGIVTNGEGEATAVVATTDAQDLPTGPISNSTISPRTFVKTFAKSTGNDIIEEAKSPKESTEHDITTTKLAENLDEKSAPTETTEEAGQSGTETTTSIGKQQKTTTAAENGSGIIGGPAVDKLLALHRMKTQLYAKLVEQQRALLEKLKSSSSSGGTSAATEEGDGGIEQKKKTTTTTRKKMLELLRKIEDQAQKAKEELEGLGAKINAIKILP